MLQTLHFGVFEADSLFPIDSLDLAETTFESKFVLNCFLLFKVFLVVPLVVKLTSLTLLSHRRFAEGFPSLAPVGSMLWSRSSYWAL